MVHWLTLHPSNSGVIGSVLVRELRSHMPWTTAKKQNKTKQKQKTTVDTVKEEERSWVPVLLQRNLTNL